MVELLLSADTFAATAHAPLASSRNGNCLYVACTGVCWYAEPPPQRGTRWRNLLRLKRRVHRLERADFGLEPGVLTLELVDAALLGIVRPPAGGRVRGRPIQDAEGMRGER